MDQYSNLTPAQILQLIQEFKDAVRDLQASRFASAAATTLYVYDIFLTLEREVDLVWSRSKFNWPTLLYFMNRYLCLGFFLFTTYDIAGFRGPLSDAHCKSGATYVGFMLAIVSWTSIMTLRATALWHQKKLLVRTVWVFWATVVIAMAVLSHVAWKQVQATMTYNVYIKLCISTVSPTFLPYIPIPATVLEVVLTSLTLAKAYTVGAHRWSTRTGAFLIRLLVRDGLAYFLVCVLLSIANMITWHFVAPSKLMLLIYLYWSIVTTCIARLMLNLRGAFYYRQQFGETTQSTLYPTQASAAKVTARTDVTGTRTPTSPANATTRFLMGEGDLGVVTTDIDEKKMARQMARPTSRELRKARNSHGFKSPVEVHVHVEEHEGMQGQGQDQHPIHLETFRLGQRNKKQYDPESGDQIPKSRTMEEEIEEDEDSKSTDFPTFAPMPIVASDHDVESQVHQQLQNVQEQPDLDHQKYRQSFLAI